MVVYVVLLTLGRQDREPAVAQVNHVDAVAHAGHTGPFARVGCLVAPPAQELRACRQQVGTLQPLQRRAVRRVDAGGRTSRQQHAHESSEAHAGPAACGPEVGNSGARASRAGPRDGTQQRRCRQRAGWRFVATN